MKNVIFVVEIFEHELRVEMERGKKENWYYFQIPFFRRIEFNYFLILTMLDLVTDLVDNITMKWIIIQVISISHDKKRKKEQGERGKTVISRCIVSREDLNLDRIKIDEAES